MIHYLIQIIAFQLFFLLVYDVFLKRETFFNWNRFYLLFTSVLALILPFVKIESFKNVVSQQYILNFPKLNLTSDLVILDEVNINAETSKPFWTLENIFLIGVTIAALLFVFKLIRVFKLIYNNPKQKSNNVLLVALMNSTAAFSFFNYIFLGERLQPKEKTSVISHEMVHVKDKHTLDLLFFELLRIVFWFNPFVYMYQNRMSELHEFIADSKAVKHNKIQYYENLLSQVFDTKAVSFINPFFKQSLIKKRIIMLQKTKSKQIQLLKYALLIPMVLGMLVYVSCSDEATNTTQSELDLSKYGYTVQLGENGLVEIPADKHEEYETFLKNNSDYVSWAQVNKQTNEITYSVHSKNEVVPENLTKVGVNMLDGGSYDMYISLPNNNQSNSKVASILIKRVDAIKDQIQIQDNISKEEEKGIELLVKMVTLNSDDVNQELIQEVQAFNDAKNKSDLHQKTTNLFNTIQEQGNISFEEELSLKTLLALVSKEFLNNANSEEVTEPIDIPIAVIDQVPVFPGCEMETTEEERKQCMNRNINKIIAQNFNTDLAKELNIAGSQRISVFFKIGTDGVIKDTKVRAVHPALEAEALRVVSMLPTMIPGEHNGKKVTVPYFVPIKFQINE